MRERPFRTGWRGGLRAAVFMCIVSIGAAAAQAAPDLLVVFVSQQFRADYLDLHRPEFSAGGFERLLSEGSVFQCRYDHLATLAAPNAAILATGSYPEIHGIVANRWYDRGRRQTVEAAEALLGGASSAEAPLRALIGSTFTDQLVEATRGRSRVVAVSEEAAPAILLAGRKPAGCYWMDDRGRFKTSAPYALAPPAWVSRFSESHGALLYGGEAWKALGVARNAPPLRVLPPPGESESSPQDFFALYRASPFAIEDVLAFARRAVGEEDLGRRGVPDVLIVNVAAPARLALETGARSPLMRDMVLRLDRSLAKFLDFLDEKRGAGNYAFVFTALHGVPPLPADARERGLEAGRVKGAEIVAAINAALRERFGSLVFVEKYLYPSVYLNQGARGLGVAAFEEALRVAGEAARSVQGVAAYYAPGVEGGPETVRPKLRRSYHADRAGDLLLAYEPYFVEHYGEGRGVASGSFYRYDTDVPLIFLGPSIPSGKFEGVVDAASIAPTLSRLLGVPPPSGATGRVLSSVLPAPAAAALPALERAAARGAR